MAWITQANLSLETPAISRLVGRALRAANIRGQRIDVRWQDSPGFAIPVRQLDNEKLVPPDLYLEELVG